MNTTDPQSLPPRTADDYDNPQAVLADSDLTPKDKRRLLQSMRTRHRGPDPSLGRKHGRR